METSSEKGKLLVLTCPTCGRRNDVPLSVSSAQQERGEWVKAVAYMDCLSFCDDDVTLKVGEEVDVNVDYPVCCREGETFSATVSDEGDFITMELLKIKKNNVHSAILHVKILALNNRCAFVKKLPIIKRALLLNTYNYHAPSGDIAAGGHCKVGNNTYNFSNTMGGGDVNFDDYIYTDEDGVDHLVQQCYSDFEETVAYYGDKVLGLHKYSPYFAPSKKLSDGTTAPKVPLGFIESLTRVYGNEKIIDFLRDATKEALDRYSSPNLGFNSTNSLYTDVNVFWIGTISIEGFFYSVKKMIEDTKDAKETQMNITIQKLYNEMVTAIASKSYDKIPIDKYLY